MMCLKITREPQGGFYRGGLRCHNMVESSFLRKPSIRKFHKNTMNNKEHYRYTHWRTQKSPPQEAYYLPLRGT